MKEKLATFAILSNFAAYTTILVLALLVIAVNGITPPILVVIFMTLWCAVISGVVIYIIRKH